MRTKPTTAKPSANVEREIYYKVCDATVKATERASDSASVSIVAFETYDATSRDVRALNRTIERGTDFAVDLAAYVAVFVASSINAMTLTDSATINTTRVAAYDAASHSTFDLVYFLTFNALGGTASVAAIIAPAVDRASAMSVTAVLPEPR